MKGKVRCKLCSRELTQSGGSTSSLKHHLQAMHPDIRYWVNKITTAKVGDNWHWSGPTRSCNDSRSGKITQLITRVVIANMLPLSFVNRETFQELLGFIEANYQVHAAKPSRPEFDSMKVKLTKSVLKELDDATQGHSFDEGHLDKHQQWRNISVWCHRWSRASGR